jgi:transcription initiation factor IIF auxiliary subunit
MPDLTQLRIQQGYHYQGDDWWDWWVWVEGPDEVLDEVAFVEYTLHPTFPNPVRTVRDRTTKFRLDTRGWGVFTIYVKVVAKDGSAVMLSHALELSYPDGTPNVA